MDLEGLIFVMSMMLILSFIKNPHLIFRILSVIMYLVLKRQ